MKKKKKEEAQEEEECSSTTYMYMSTYIVESHVLSYAEHSEFQLLNIVYQLHEMVSLSLRLQCIKKRSKIAWNSFCFVFDLIVLSLSFTRMFVYKLSSWNIRNANIRTHRIYAHAYRHGHIGLQAQACIYMEQKPCALFTPSSLRVDYIDVRSRRAELNKKPQQQQRRKDAEIGKHGFMCACVWRVSHSPTHFFSFVSVACCHTTLFFSRCHFTTISCLLFHLCLRISLPLPALLLRRLLFT